MREPADAERIWRLARELGRSKLERELDLDLADVRSMVESGQVEPVKLRELFAAIEPDLYRFPSVDPASLAATVRSLSEPATVADFEVEYGEVREPDGEG